MGFSRFWLTMADKEIKVHRRVIRMIFPMIHRAKNDRSLRRALPEYDNGQNMDFIFRKLLSKLVYCPSGWDTESRKSVVNDT